MLFIYGFWNVLKKLANWKTEPTSIELTCKITERSSEWNCPKFFLENVNFVQKYNHRHILRKTLVVNHFSKQFNSMLQSILEWMAANNIAVTIAEAVL